MAPATADSSGTFSLPPFSELKGRLAEGDPALLRLLGLRAADGARETRRAAPGSPTIDGGPEGCLYQVTLQDLSDVADDDYGEDPVVTARLPALPPAPPPPGLPPPVPSAPAPPPSAAGAPAPPADYAGRLADARRRGAHLAAAFYPGHAATLLRGVVREDDVDALRAMRDRMVEEAGGAALDPMTRLLIDQAFVLHAITPVLLTKALAGGSAEVTRILLGAAARLQGELRKTALAVRDRQVTVSAVSAVSSGPHIVSGVSGGAGCAGAGR
jgi:hypothetical protein